MRKIKIILVVAILVIANNVFSQAKWSFKTNKINDSIVELELKVSLDKGFL